MKKLLSISVIAALAVLPMAANAAEGDREVTALAAATGGSTTNLATTSYVQGAYNAVKTQFDKMVTDTAVTGTHNYIDAGKTVAHNLAELDTAVKSLEGSASDAYQLKANSTVADKDAQENTITYNYIQSGTGVAANLVALDTRAKTNADAISNEATARAQADTAIENTIGSEAMGTTATTVKGAIAEIDGKVDTLTGDANTSGSLAYEAKARADADTAINDNIGTMSNLATTADTLVGAINEVNTAVSTLTTTAGNTYQTLNDSNVATGTYDHITQGQGVGTNLVNLDTAVSVIENKQIPIVSDWSTNAVTNTKISQLTGTVDCTLTANASNPACTQ